MADIEMSITGGDKLRATLERIAARLGRGGEVAVGFLEGATYPAKPDQPAQNVATVAFWNEFGTLRAPPRAFFRRMISAESPGWGHTLAAAAKKTDYSSEKTLGVMGTVVAGQLQKSINELTSPPLSPKTIARKGFAKPLIDTGVMLRAVDYEVKIP